ncbi:MAG: type II toxin-antitoxin system prevent-host-death family antitoxin [Gloeobacterales cyanobacterium]
MSVKEARSNLSALLDRVAAGEEVILLRRGKEVARLVPPQSQNLLPSLKDFRESLRITGAPLSAEVVKAREEERY